MCCFIVLHNNFTNLLVNSVTLFKNQNFSFYEILIKYYTIVLYMEHRQSRILCMKTHPVYWVDDDNHTPEGVFRYVII